MKKLLIAIIALLTITALTGCDSNESILELNNQELNLSSEDSLVTLSYLSAGFLDLGQNQGASEIGFALLSEDEEPKVNQELDEINVYFDLLKDFIDNGASNFGSIAETISDRTEYEFMIDISVSEEAYILYYNVDSLTGEITGIFVIGTEEYLIIATNSLEDSDEFEAEHKNEDEDEYEDEDDEEHEEDDEQVTTELPEVEEETTTKEETTIEEFDSEGGASETSATEMSATLLDSDEDEDEHEENETKMVLTATNGENTIKITYKTETEANEQETKFEIEKDINGVETEIQLKISIEDDEYKLEIEDGFNHYEFKSEIEDDGIVYKLEYEVDGVEGEIKIYETTDLEGNVVYVYEINEGDFEIEVEKEEPESEGFDDEDDDEEDEEDEIGFFF